MKLQGVTVLKLQSQSHKEFAITRDHGGLAGFRYSLDDLHVTDVTRKGPAYRAGLRQGQIITHVDSVEVTTKNAKDAFDASRGPDRSFTIRVKAPAYLEVSGSSVQPGKMGAY